MLPRVSPRHSIFYFYYYFLVGHRAGKLRPHISKFSPQVSGTPKSWYSCPIAGSCIQVYLLFHFDSQPDIFCKTSGDIMKLRKLSFISFVHWTKSFFPSRFLGQEQKQSHRKTANLKSQKQFARFYCSQSTASWQRAGDKFPVMTFDTSDECTRLPGVVVCFALTKFILLWRNPGLSLAKIQQRRQI